MCAKAKNEVEKLKASAEYLGHVPTVEEVSYMTDQCRCSCGWASTRYWDGAEYAFDEWIKHAKTIVGSTQ
ncbi:MAG: hypothetical protein UR98_C0004G0017 [Parcubacteria group bacterium GW2011_GWA1_36_12]|nr:MAG: hypothetical protein UR98_C0004G0017 [Parcubacteria group bacterium GW2011_GWA1_36_12]